MPAGHDAPHTYDAQVRITPALRVQEWIAVAGAKTAYIERGSPWENGYIESFNARLRDELLQRPMSPREFVLDSAKLSELRVRWSLPLSPASISVQG